jgi:protoporphyrinogen oxidase
VRVTTDRGEFVTDRVVSTLPTRVTTKLLPTLPTFQRRYEWGQALGAHCLILALDRQLMERVYWLSVCDPDYPFLAVVEHTNFMPPSDYGGRRLVYLGNYLPMDDPLFTMDRFDVLEAYLPALRRLNPAFDQAWITKLWMFSAPYAQPVVTPDYHRHIPPHETPIKNIYLANMFQVYPQDRGQNYAVAMANDLAARLG